MAWKIVQAKKFGTKSTKKCTSIKLLKQNVLIGMQSIFEKHTNNIKCVFLYGSTSRETNTETSDIDILVIWKKNYNSLLAHNLKKEIELLFFKKVDFASMIYKNKVIYDFNNIRTQNECFIENVYRDAVSIFGDRDDILFSIHIGKI